MKTFNKYQFIRDLNEEIEQELSYNYSRGIEITYDTIDELIHTSVENQCIYAYDAWAIAYELGENDFENPITGETCKDIYELAFYSLLDYVQSEIDIDAAILDFETENI